MQLKFFILRQEERYSPNTDDGLATERQHQELVAHL